MIMIRLATPVGILFGPGSFEQGLLQASFPKGEVALPPPHSIITSHPSAVRSNAWRKQKEKKKKKRRKKRNWPAFACRRNDALGSLTETGPDFPNRSRDRQILEVGGSKSPTVDPHAADSSTPFGRRNTRWSYPRHDRITAGLDAGQAKHVLPVSWQNTTSYVCR